MADHELNQRRDKEYGYTVFSNTHDLDQTARALAANIESYKAEFSSLQTIIPFEFKIIDGRWTSAGQTLEELVRPNELGGDRIGRYILTEQRMMQDDSISEAVIISEDLGYGRSFVYWYKKDGDSIQARAIEFQGTEAELHRFQKNLSEYADNHSTLEHNDFSQPLFFRNMLQINNIYSAIDNSFQSPQRRIENAEYLGRIQHDFVRYDQLLRDYSSDIDRLTRKFTQELLQHDDLRQGFSAIVNGYIEWTAIDEQMAERRSQRIEPESRTLNTIHTMMHENNEILPYVLPAAETPVNLVSPDQPKTAQTEFINESSTLQFKSEQADVVILNRFDGKTVSIRLSEKTIKILNGVSAEIQQKQGDLEVRIETIEHSLRLATIFSDGSIVPIIVLDQLTLSNQETTETLYPLVSDAYQDIQIADHSGNLVEVLSAEDTFEGILYLLLSFDDESNLLETKIHVAEQSNLLLALITDNPEISPILLTNLRLLTEPLVFNQANLNAFFEHTIHMLPSIQIHPNLEEIGLKNVELISTSVVTDQDIDPIQIENNVNFISMIIATPELTGMFVGILNVVNDQTEISREKEMHTNILMMHLSELLALRNTQEKDNTTINVVDLIKERPVPKHIPVSEMLAGPNLTQKKDSVPIIDFSIILIISILLAHQKQNKDIRPSSQHEDTRQSALINSHETPWLLAAIILYMAKIREQGMVRYVKPTGKKKKKQRATLPQSGIIYMVSLGYV